VPRYALLLRASANRVFGASAATLARGELDLLGERVLSRSLPSAVESVAGVEYVVLDVADPIETDEWEVLCHLSGLHAAFELETDGRLRPVECTPRRLLDEDLVTIQRYTGKTNEAFTHLLVNVALASGDGALRRLLAGERLRLLDPVCGRGTTLNRAALYGLDAFGIEVEQRHVAAYETFITTWLKDKRLKHTVERATMRKGRARAAHRVTIRFGPSKDTSTHATVDIVHDDSTNVRDHHAARSIDLLAADLPYGVQHGAAGSEGRARDPEAFLLAALPAWREVLRPGAGIALAWNRRTLPRPRFVDIATAAGFEVAEATDDRFLHRVDRSILRDVLVGRRPRA
jgi:SAM-dependent methyltransferase